MNNDPPGKGFYLDWRKQLIAQLIVWGVLGVCGLWVTVIVVKLLPAMKLATVIVAGALIGALIAVGAWWIAQDTRVDEVNVEPVFDKIRITLNEINPDILKEIDKGSNRIRVFLSGPTYNKIVQLIEREPGKAYLTIERGNNNSLIGIGGPHDRYQGTIIERIPDGPFTDYVLVPQPRLRK